MGTIVEESESGLGGGRHGRERDQDPRGQNRRDAAWRSSAPLQQMAWQAASLRLHPWWAFKKLAAQCSATG